MNLLTLSNIVHDKESSVQFLQLRGHLTVNRNLNFVDPQTGAHIQNVERSWKSSKERNKRHNGTHRNMLESYLCEWMWRQRHRNIDMFDQVLANIVTYWPPQ